MRNSGSDGEGGGLLSSLTHIDTGKVDGERILNFGTNRSEAANYLPLLEVFAIILRSHRNLHYLWLSAHPAAPCCSMKAESSMVMLIADCKGRKIQ